jgi:CRP-like cAMP-binding protein
MASAFISKLRGYEFIPAADVASLEAACRVTRDCPARHDLIREGDEPGPLFVILSGWACRYKMLPDGSRQITAFLMPGDFCDMHLSILDEMDHSIATLTPAKVALVQRAELNLLIQTRPAIVRAFWWTQLVDEGILRAWIVSMGRRSSIERVAHLMCELYIRARNIGLAHDDHVELPLTQPVLGDALGLTPVHINRVLARLRDQGIMELRGGMLVIGKPGELARIAGFDDNYLHRRSDAARRPEAQALSPFSKS